MSGAAALHARAAQDRRGDPGRPQGRSASTRRSGRSSGARTSTRSSTASTRCASSAGPATTATPTTSCTCCSTGKSTRIPAQNVAFYRERCVARAAGQAHRSDRPRRARRALRAGAGDRAQRRAVGAARAHDPARRVRQAACTATCSTRPARCASARPGSNPAPEPRPRPCSPTSSADSRCSCPRCWACRPPDVLAHPSRARRPRDRACSASAPTPRRWRRCATELGLDRPLWVQYGRFLTGLATGDLGRSLKTREKVVIEMASASPRRSSSRSRQSCSPRSSAWPSGVLAARWRRSFLDVFVMAGSLAGVSMPIFWLGLLVILLFSVAAGLAAAGGPHRRRRSRSRASQGSCSIDTLLAGSLRRVPRRVRHLVLPASCSARFRWP